MSDRIRICYIGDGGSIHTQRWITHFAGLGHDVHLITNRDVKLDRVTVHYIGGKGTIHYIKRVLKSRRLIKDIKPDIVHAHFVTDSGFIGAMSGFHPFVVSPWGSDIVRQPEESAVFRFMVKYALRKADVIQCGDENGAARVKSLIGWDDTVRIVGWGIDTDMFQPAGSRKDGEIRILYLRISHDNYNTSVLLKAMPEILRKHPNVKFTILKKGEQIERTLEAIEKMGMHDRIELIDFVPHEKLAGLLNSCDIYVDTFYTETPGSGLGITALEAMSCGLPVVVADTQGFDESVKHMESGYVYKGRDHSLLADAIDKVVSDADLREHMGANARKYIVNSQNWNKNMKKMEEIYMGLSHKGDST